MVQICCGNPQVTEHRQIVWLRSPLKRHHHQANFVARFFQGFLVGLNMFHTLWKVLKAMV